MSYVSHLFNSPFTVIAESLNRWKAAYDSAVIQYYNQRIELNPEAEAQQYWDCLKHPQSKVNLHEISDVMLSRLMHSMIQQGISKFAVDRFILEVRRLKRSHQSLRSNL